VAKEWGWTMEPIIKSLLDTDNYKLSMMWFVLATYPEVDVSYQFNNRSKDMKFTKEAVDEIRNQINLMANLRLQDEEYNFIRDNIPYLPITFRQYLAAYRFNPNQVNLWLDADNQLQLEIQGKWRDTILWEVPLMAIISEVYFKMIDTDWNMSGQIDLARNNARQLCYGGCKYADFGTRRRRNFETQNIVVDQMKKYVEFVGTSNPYLAMKHNVKALGTLAHELVMATAALESMNRPNKFIMENWAKVYQGALGTMLPDTFGIESFLHDFTLDKAKLWDGVRHDSGDPFMFTDKIIKHYKKLRIDPLLKTIIFSDGLNVEKAIQINEYCRGKVGCSFGIGTFFTNNFNRASNLGEISKPLNMVIKLKTVNGIPVVKLSDTPTKAIGDETMVRIMKHIHFGETL
jgi:nicotinate phosphoribosyltransferase